MTVSRRDFLRSVGVCAAAAGAGIPELSASTQGPLKGKCSDRMVHLDRNENPYGPSKKALAAMQSACFSTNRYPSSCYDELRETIAEFHNTSPDRVLLGCGSTEILRAAASAFLQGGEQLIQAKPTFEGMEQAAELVKARVVSVPLDRKFAHNLEKMLAEVNSSTGLIYICNPNNPTASVTPASDFQAFVDKLPSHVPVLIDEAYHHYAGQSPFFVSAVDRAVHDEHTIVCRTFSAAYGLAGLRLGYCVASPAFVQKMQPFTTLNSVNSVVLWTAIAALEDKQSLNQFITQNLNDRQEFFNRAMGRRLKPIDSHANFALMNTYHPADMSIEHFRKRGVLIGPAYPSMNTYIRVSFGLPEEMEAFWKAWDELPFAKEMMMHH